MRGIGTRSAPALGMNAAQGIGINSNLTGNAVAVMKAPIGPDPGSGSEGNVSGWTSVLEALGLKSEVSAPGTAASSRSSLGCDVHASRGLHEVPFQPPPPDQLGSKISPYSKLIARGGSPQKPRTTLTAIIPKAVDRAATGGTRSLRGRKFRIDSDASETPKSEPASEMGIYAVPAMQVPVAPPVGSNPAPVPADTGFVRSHASITTPHHAQQDGGHDASAMHEGPVPFVHPQGNLNLSPADAESGVPVKAAASQGGMEPTAAEGVHENEPLPDLASRKEQNQSKNTPAQIDFIWPANPSPAPAGAAPVTRSVNPVPPGDSVKKVPASTSFPERITKSASKAVTDFLHSEKRTEASESASVLSPVLREAGGFTGPAERPVSPGHDASREGIDPFATLDAERATPAPTWIHAGAHRAEAGFLDPVLGWVGVRADSIANAVHASVVPASGEAAQVLGSHLAGLNTYLSEHHGQPATVTMAAPQEGRGGMDTHPGDRQSSRHEHAPAREETALPSTRVPAHVLVGASLPTPARASLGGARYISVVV